MALIRSLLFALFFYAGSVVCVLSGFPAAAIGPRPVRAVVRAWATWHRLCARWILCVRNELSGSLPPGQYLAVCKHQSMYETIEALLIFDDPVVVMKRELSDLPFWGWVARQYGIIAVDREGSAGALRALMAAARDAVATGRSIVLFPEGTRVPPGETPPLRAGFAALYKMLQLPVVPVALDSGRLLPRRTLIKRAGVVHWHFGDVIAPGSDRSTVEADVHAAINLFERSPVPASRAG